MITLRQLESKYLRRIPRKFRMEINRYIDHPMVQGLLTKAIEYKLSDDEKDLIYKLGQHRSDKFPHLYWLLLIYISPWTIAGHVTGRLDKMGVKIFDNPPVGAKWAGPAWRAESGFTHERGATALDVVNFEAEDLGNEDTRKQALSTGIDLSKIPADDVVWVGEKKSVVSQYTAEGRVPVTKVDLPKHAVVLADDGEGGYLVYRGDKKLTGHNPPGVLSRDEVDKAYRKGYWRIARRRMTPKHPGDSVGQFYQYAQVSRKCPNRKELAQSIAIHYGLPDRPMRFASFGPRHNPDIVGLPAEEEHKQLRPNTYRVYYGNGAQNVIAWRASRKLSSRVKVSSQYYDRDGYLVPSRSKDAEMEIEELESYMLDLKNQGYKIEYYPKNVVCRPW